MAEQIDGDHGRDVKTVIFDGAEGVFATYGYHGATTRAIAEAADVNLAMIHYHFGSKQQLYEKILVQRAAELGAVRLQRLEQALKGSDQLKLEDVLNALLQPLREFAQRNLATATNYARMINQVAYAGDELSIDLMSKLFDDIAQRFIEAIDGSLPGLGRANAISAYTYAIVIGGHVLVRMERIGWLSGELQPNVDLDQAFEQAVKFLSGGIRAMVSAPS